MSISHGSTSAVRAMTKSTRNSPRLEQEIPKATSLSKENYELTPQKIQEILDGVASNYGASNLVGGSLQEEVYDFSHLSNEEVDKMFFLNFDENEFISCMNVDLSELKSLPSEIPKKLAVNIIASGVSRYCSNQRSTLGSPSKYLLSLLDEFERRFIQSLRKEIINI